jgi:hypothetical protein
VIKYKIQYKCVFISSFVPLLTQNITKFANKNTYTVTSAVLPTFVNQFANNIYPKTLTIREEDDGFYSHQGREVPLISIQEEEENPLPSIHLDNSSIHQEHQPADELIFDMGQGIENNTNFSNKYYIQKRNRASKNNFKKKM